MISTDNIAKETVKHEEMETIKVHDIGAEKANAISRYRRIQRITTLLRFVEVFVFLIVVSRFSTQFSFSLKLSSEYFRGVSVTLISPKSVFVIGNAIVVALILISGQFSSKTSDFYDEYVEECRNYNPQVSINKVEKKSIDRYRSSACCNNGTKIIRRVQSEHLIKVEERHGSLRRSASDKCEKKSANEMSSEEFRRTVEAFIERQQRFLKEEEEEQFLA
ncbi:uncharacterized protein LOC127262662 [Andrographis paniculata]|uniref:uncharacterized protein LOC127262662 n=1 Tax=Andrographis paniculata TaxID=175694 RepID=UPI0021E7E301|nr:uncharacterized protein LOC127262662 [Andrographis paniculata]